MESRTFESRRRSIIELLLPLKYLEPDSRKYFFRMCGDFYSHGELFIIYSHIEWFTLFDYLKSTRRFPSFSDGNTLEELKHFLFEKRRKIIGNMCESCHDSAKYLIEKELITRHRSVKLPWFLLIDVLIELSRKGKSAFECISEIKRIHIPDILREVILSFSSDEGIFISADFSFGKFECKGEGTVQEISEIIRKLCIKLSNCFLSIEISIFSYRKSGEKIIQKKISGILSDIRDGIDHVSDSFRHLLSIDGEVTSHEKLLRCFISGTPEHRWPIHSMETHDIFSYDMEISWPPLLFFTLTHGKVIKRSIIPDIPHLLRIKWKRNPEFIGFS